MKVRKVNFSNDGAHTAIYVNGELTVHTSPPNGNDVKIDGIHIEMWIDGLMFGLSRPNEEMDWLTVNCIDDDLNKKVASGSHPPFLFDEVKVN